MQCAYDALVMQLAQSQVGRTVIAGLSTAIVQWRRQLWDSKALNLANPQIDTCKIRAFS